jgi:hypothetical protein
MVGVASRVRRVDFRIIDPREAPKPTLATRAIRDALRAIADRVTAQGVLFGDRPRLVVDLAPRAPIRDPARREIPLYTSTPARNSASRTDESQGVDQGIAVETT